LNTQRQSATVFGDVRLGSGGPCDNNITITSSLLAGGGYMLYACSAASDPGTSTLTVTNNRFARCATGAVSDGDGLVCSGGQDSHGYWPQGGYFGLDSYTYCSPASDVTWSGNVWDDNNATAGC
jgi:hypothetical protein